MDDHPLRGVGRFDALAEEMIGVEFNREIAESYITMLIAFNALSPEQVALLNEELRTFAVSIKDLVSEISMARANRNLEGFLSDVLSEGQ